MDLQAHMSAPLGAFVVYLFVTFVFYWWHRWRHEVYFFWLICHQLHHSASRIETITSFYKHPIELVINSIMIAFITFGLFGLSVEGSGWLLLYTATGEYFYHMNVRTPPWLGYVFQRPEMHRIHHERGRHYSNFSDLPVWDMLFGTFRNPPTFDRPCGFKPEREQKFWQILACRDVNDPMPTRKLEKSA
jgi:sterol desaturase/sphingolipid hydroxylase (fatty acid hydroxylase superfamily)